MLFSLPLPCVHRIDKDASGAVTGITATLNPGGDVKKTKLKLTWLAQVEGLVKLKLEDFDYLISKKKVGGEKGSGGQGEGKWEEGTAGWQGGSLGCNVPSRNFLLL